MDDASLLGELIGVARRLGLQVRELPASCGDDPPFTSAACRLHGRLLIVLSALDHPGHRIELLADALRSHAGAALEGTYLLPAVRKRLGLA